MACVVCKIWFESWLRPKPLTPEVSIKRLEKVGRTFFSDTHFFFFAYFPKYAYEEFIPGIYAGSSWQNSTALGNI